jgi:hypothetical protein
MTVSIHQPGYLPWFGLMDKIAKSDQFIVLDNVQLSDSTYQVRNIFLTQNSSQKILSIPISKKNYLNNVIKAIRIAENQNWQKKHLDFLRENYKKHPFYTEIFEVIDPFYNKNYLFVFDAIFDSMLLLFRLLGIELPVIL